MSIEDIELAHAGSSVDPARAAAARSTRRVIETRGHVSVADLAGGRGAWYSDTQAFGDGFAEVTPYDLRHTAASRAISAGGNRQILQAVARAFVPRRWRSTSTRTCFRRT